MGQITDLTGYTWVGNDTIYNISIPDEYINFISNNTNYIALGQRTTGPEEYGLAYIKSNDHSDFAHSSGWWFDEAYKTIQITGGTDVTNPELIAWLEANGTLTVPTISPITEDNGNWKVTSGEEDIRLHTAHTYLDKDIVIAACPKPPAAEDAEF